MLSISYLSHAKYSVLLICDAGLVVQNNIAILQHWHSAQKLLKVKLEPVTFYVSSVSP